MTGRTHAELEGRLAQHLKEEVEHLTATIDTNEQRVRFERRLRPVRRRRRPLYLSAIAIATALVIVTVAVLIDGAGSGRDVTAPADTAPAGSTFTSEISPLNGLRFTWPTAGWRAVDSQSEVDIHPPGVSSALVRVTKGLYPTDPSGALLPTRKSAISVIDALRGMPALKASRPVREYIGEGLAAIHVDIHLSASAPRSGFQYLTYRGSSVTAAAYSISKGMFVRVYAAVFLASYGKELLNIAVEARTARQFRKSTSLADRALQTLRLPKGLVVGRTFHV